jgi:hypothetical protein
VGAEQRTGILRAGVALGGRLEQVAVRHLNR